MSLLALAVASRWRFLIFLAELLSRANERERFNCIESERRCAREEAERSWLVTIFAALLRGGSSNSTAVAAAAATAMYSSELLKVRVHSLATAVAADCNLDPERCSNLATSKVNRSKKSQLAWLNYSAVYISRGSI
uniref:Secreted protein n=1 Tax=Trichogramma kaykai TaxID=54128 RepID=A0ABD2XB00_9HYME